MGKKPIIGITMGDAAGIGPEIIVKALSKKEVYRISSPLVIGDGKVMSSELIVRSSELKINSISRIGEAKFKFGTIDLVDLKNIKMGRLKIGTVNKMAAKAAVGYIKKAVSLARKGEINAIVTAPINKEGLKKAGFEFPGHTELLAHLTKTKNYAMMLVGGPLRVVLVTTHLPLSKVSSSLSKEKIYQTIRLTWDNMKYFGTKKPRIGVAGLNPHAGEEGLFGKEEKEFIIPAVEEAKKKGIRVEGPISPDTVFYRALQGEFDCVICMYHDQGLIPLKMLAFDKGVNITLGLPIIRTSVDHGTAYEIAGKGVANPQSLIEAIGLAAKLVKARSGGR
ncbi:4-hydroxythreonine-4-phosphate dehydrogenase PdxA [bacterium]|nr:4-hydroxythreonine-4-phosphate dehydrogenase PdxA [bacterium]MBU4560775.1 4-hydroxythreonine-4-phosphate dehydrogenase PdxA [bacterium]MCG2676056.1 4-hydroxythreonine-4-phosphate dehydrogenase PdxA [bacterium]MCG2677946.1 4-hydroxythreonine-4-phosphate dehydrogenase PdxA [bacterium]